VGAERLEHELLVPALDAHVRELLPLGPDATPGLGQLDGRFAVGVAGEGEREVDGERGVHAGDEAELERELGGRGGRVDGGRGATGREEGEEDGAGERPVHGRSLRR
jgi:hypothetical protein